MEPSSESTRRPESPEDLPALGEGDAALEPGEWDLETLLNAPVLQSLMEDYAKLTLTVTAILDLKGKVLVAVGWQDLCTKFHRAHPESCRNCTESDLYLAGHVRRGEYVAYKCRNGLWDVVTPLYVADTHMGNIYTGQFFYDDEVVDRAFFARQAEAYGYDKAAYLEALDRVPRFTRAQVRQLMDFLVKFTDLVSKFTLGNLRAVAFIREQARSAAALKQSEAALRDSQAMLALVLDSIPQAVSWKDLAGTYLGCNMQFARLAGLRDPSGIAGLTDFDLPWSPEQARAVRDDDRQVLALGRPQPPALKAYPQPDGTSLYFETTKAPLFDGSGEPFAILSIHRDLTEAKRSEQERARLKDQLQQVQKMESLGSLAGGVAHDMNNVLGAILGLASANVEVLPPGNAARTAFETIIKATERGRAMVRSLLSFARKDATDARPLDLNRLLQEEVAILERTTLAKVRIELDLAPDLRPVRGDESSLSHAVMNLCVNAVDAIAGTGTLSLRTRNLDGGRVEMQVQDTGAGMSREVLDRAMDPFFTTKEVGKGTGLGLSMVYSTMQAHHGEIEILSEPGAGTLVALRFPACDPDGPARSGDGAPAPRRMPRDLRILVVDDDELMRASTGTVLQTLGCAVLQAESGERALDLLGQGTEVDAIILDMNMPGLGGMRTLARIRAGRPALPVLICTGLVEPGLLGAIAADRHAALLAKPYTRDELAARLEAVVRVPAVPGGAGNGGGPA